MLDILPIQKDAAQNLGQFKVLSSFDELAHLAVMDQRRRMTTGEVWTSAAGRGQLLRVLL